MTSVGRIAVPLSMFSQAGSTPVTDSGSPSSAMAPIAPTTAAPPAMSAFCWTMSDCGLRKYPPVSNVTDLPTSASRGASARRAARGA